ncbi:MAG: tRNA pseudouridine(55) synthase TruB, partial [Treponema sp.]|nr:tRNA pseudouridine(55) synthase TruB [Treponema sp.]
MGIIFFDKPTGITSFDALRDIKRSLGTGKVGHTGTLDKFAQGLLIVLTGRDLKLSRWFTSCDKKYLAKIRFGLETDTLDPEGKPIAEAPLPSREDVEQVLPQFTGDILQAPPAYSAMRINGKRASDLTRSGEAPEMKKRPVKIHQLELQSWQPPFAEIFVHCSSGTYIRSLARDIALAAGSRGHLVELTRTQVADFLLETGDRGEGIGNHLPITKSIITTLGISCFDITAEKAQDARNGKLLEKILEDVPLELLKECTT